MNKRQFFVLVTYILMFVVMLMTVPELTSYQLPVAIRLITVVAAGLLAYTFFYALASLKPGLIETKDWHKVVHRVQFLGLLFLSATRASCTTNPGVQTMLGFIFIIWVILAVLREREYAKSS